MLLLTTMHRISQWEAYTILPSHRGGSRSHDTRRIHCVLRSYASSLVAVFGHLDLGVWEHVMEFRILISISVYIFLIDEVSDIRICLDACIS